MSSVDSNERSFGVREFAGSGVVRERDSEMMLREFESESAKKREMLPDRRLCRIRGDVVS